MSKDKDEALEIYEKALGEIYELSVVLLATCRSIPGEIAEGVTDEMRKVVGIVVRALDDHGGSGDPYDGYRENSYGEPDHD